MAEDHPVVVSPWVPETDPYKAAALGKLLEELNECGAIVARCLIQGIEENEPVTGVPNREALMQEIGDAQAMMEIAIQTFHLDRSRIQDRRMGKVSHMIRWFRLLQERL